MRAGKFLDDLPAPIRTAVVDQDDFTLRGEVRENSPDPPYEFRKRGLAPVHGNDHRDGMMRGAHD